MSKKQTKKLKRHTPLVVGNWKMNPESIGEAKKLFLEIRKSISRKTLQTYVAIAPPAVFLSELERLSPSQRVKLAAQDVFHEKTGPYTGEMSLSMFKSVGVSSVIVGHSERRALGDTDEDIQKSVEAVLKANLTAIVCVGEKIRDAQGHYFTVVETQVLSAIKGLSKSKVSQLIIAYEPIWAISKGDGKGKTATPEDAHEMKLFIQKILADFFGRKTVDKIRILYGGSVNSQNAEELFAVGQVDGFLVGGASLKPKEFISIINTVETYANT